MTDLDVRFTHLRNYDADGKVSQYGGTTICEVFYDGALVATGGAHCRSTETFSRKLGRTISKGRAEKFLRDVGRQGLPS